MTYLTFVSNAVILKADKRADEEIWVHRDGHVNTYFALLYVPCSRDSGEPKHHGPCPHGAYLPDLKRHSTILSYNHVRTFKKETYNKKTKQNLSNTEKEKLPPKGL